MNYTITENEYVMANESLYGSLFATSNGYMGIRGSFEENGTLSVQGGFVRGLIDEIPFNQSLKIDNEYMRKFYVNEDAAKIASVQEGIINFADILLIRISIDGETFYPWEGKIIKWERSLDMKNNKLTRNVMWENSKSDVTVFEFERFASFSNDHIYVIKVNIIPQNHNKEVKIISGVDLRTKSNGFKMCELTKHTENENSIYFDLITKGKYNHKFNIAIFNSFTSEKNRADEQFITQEYTYQSECGKKYEIEKKIYIATSRDENVEFDKDTEILKEMSYDELYKKHQKAWRKFFDKIDIKIDGDDRADKALRFCNYHTAVSICRNDSVHSLAAKNLTGEGYNDYVWWDCEIYQSPIFVYTGIEAAKNTLMYRYNNLYAAKKAAKEENRQGARYPFISSVTGEEKVWQHVRHPFMQYHVVADVAWGVLNYYYVTDDKEFIKNYGLEMLSEIADYWVSRAELVNDRYEIKCVTGCDEHHPYVNNDAYTNYLVKYIVDNTIKLAREYGLTVKDKWIQLSDKLYLPMDKSGLIPQFDGYFDLNWDVESIGGGTSEFQMKTQGGMYHKSQIIKQPDVMVLFSYIHNNFDKKTYELNWDYYEAMCEASSSLTFPVHSICAFDNNQLYKGYKYFMQCAELDLKNVNGSYDGVHAGCMAGAWYSIVRGLAGIEMNETCIKMNPKMLRWWDKFSFKLQWHKVDFTIEIDQEKCVIIPDSEIVIQFKNECRTISSRTEFLL